MFSLSNNKRETKGDGVQNAQFVEHISLLKLLSNPVSTFVHLSSDKVSLHFQDFCAFCT